MDDAPKCPECGRTLMPCEDNIGRTYQCTGMDCLSFFDADEIDEIASPEPAPQRTLPMPMENEMNETPAMHDQITPEAMQTVIAQLEYLASDHRYVAKSAAKRHGEGATDESGFMTLPHNSTIGTYKRRAELFETVAVMLRAIAAERETPETSK